MINSGPGPAVTFSSKNELQYRQHYAAPYFRCAVYENDEQKSYNALHKNVKKGEIAEKTAKANAKEAR